MKTNKGKEFNLNDVVYFSEEQFDINLVILDQNKQVHTSKLFNTKENKEKIVTSMRQIKGYYENENGEIEVRYEDGMILIFKPEFKDTIIKIYNNQKELERRKQLLEEYLEIAKLYHDSGNYKKEFEYYKKAAEQGNAEAQFHLGYMYSKGLGVEQDYKEAVKWYRLSAEQGNAKAQFNLGFMYFTGLGVEQDKKEALKKPNLI